MQITVLVLATLMLAAAASAQPAAHETTLDDQQSVAVTAYNNGLALVRDVRELSLPSGAFELRFTGVAEHIRPETVGLRSLSSPGSVTILEQNYEYDLISPQKLMEKYVGKEVTLRNYSEELGFESVDATLMSVNKGAVYQVDGQIWLGHPGQVVLPEIPDNLIAKPSLIWTLGGEGGQQTLEATYLTNGISWKADYVLTLARDDQSLDLAGWVTMDNNSGATYENAKLKLVAGDVNVVADEAGFGGGLMMERAMAAAPPMPQQEAFAEYHLYTMPRRTTIKQNQSKQLALLNATGVACRKVYEYRGQPHFFSHRIGPMEDERPEVFIVFQNEEDNAMGVPLPGGVMRIYQEDSEGMLQFAGEDRIEHTPKDEEVTLRMGKAFDVVAERVQTDYTVLGENAWESAFKVTIRNHKELAVTVDVVEPMPGDWEIANASHEHEKRDARTAVFALEIPAGGETVLTYTVRVRTR